MTQKNIDIPPDQWDRIRDILEMILREDDLLWLNDLGVEDEKAIKSFLRQLKIPDGGS